MHDLVLYEGDEGRHDQRHARGVHRRELQNRKKRESSASVETHGTDNKDLDPVESPIVVLACRSADRERVISQELPYLHLEAGYSKAGRDARTAPKQRSEMGVNN